MSILFLTAFFAVCTWVYSGDWRARNGRGLVVDVGICIVAGWVMAAMFAGLMSGDWHSHIDPNAGQHM